MSRDYTVPLWLLKLGAPLNAYFFFNTPSSGDPLIVEPARILFVVSAYRCLFPVRYEGNIVFHDTVLSSILLCRLLATFSEIAYIFLFSHVLRVLDAGHTAFVGVVSFLMVAQVLICQVLVWTAVLTGHLKLYFYEELGWALIFAANTAASAYLLLRAGAPTTDPLLLKLSLLFGAGYMPWQFLHLRMLWAEARIGSVKPVPNGMPQGICARNRRTDAASWGGGIGLSWMIGYWATIIPGWVYVIVLRLADR